MRRSATLLILLAALFALWALWRGRGAGGGGAVDRGGEGAGQEPASALDRAPEAASAELLGRPRHDGPVGPEGTSGRLPPPVDLSTVERERDLHGVVVDTEGRPVGGARLHVVTHPWRRASLLANDRYDEREEGPSGVSASDGTFRLALRPGTRVALRVEADGFAPLRFTERSPGERLRVVLRRGVGLVVRAVDPDGHPLEGVTVEVSGASRAHGSFQVEAETGADGRARFPDLPAGRSLGLEAYHGARGGFHYGTEAVELPEEGELEHEIRISPGWTVTGRVVDKGTGFPVPGARVGMGWTLFKETRTDADGRYALGGWVGNYYMAIGALAAGYARAEVAVGERREIDFELVPGFAASGRVEGVGRGPLAGAQVAVIGFAFSPGGAQRISTAHGRTKNGDGFLLADLTHGMPHVLVVMHPGFGRTLLSFDAPPDGTPELELGTVLLPKARLISGRVLDDQGTPLPGERVNLHGANADRDRLRPDGAAGVDDDYGHEEERRTDDLGRFAFGDLAPGTYMLTARREGGVEVSRRVVLETGADVRDLDLRFDADRALRVRVVDPRGRGLAQILVQVTADSLGRRTEWTREGGVATFRLPRDVSEVVVEALDFDEHPYVFPPSRTVAVEEGEHVVALETAEIVKGRLLGPDGNGINRAAVEVRRSSEIVAYANTDTEGRFAAEVKGDALVDLAFDGRRWLSDGDGRLREVRRALTATLSGVKPGSPEVELVARAVPADRTLEIRVLDSAGRAVSAAEVMLRPWPEDWGTPKPRQTDGEGIARLERLTPRPTQVRVRPPEERQEELSPRSVEVERPGEEILVVRLRPHRHIRGVVVDENGQVVAGATAFSRVERDLYTALTDDEGRFDLKLPSDPTHDLHVRAYHKDAEGVDRASGQIPVKPGEQELRLEIRVTTGH